MADPLNRLALSDQTASGTGRRSVNTAKAMRPAVRVPSLGVTTSGVFAQIASGGLASPVTIVSRATGAVLANFFLSGAMPRFQPSCRLDYPAHAPSRPASSSLSNDRAAATGLGGPRKTNSKYEPAPPAPKMSLGFQELLFELFCLRLNPVDVQFWR